MAEVAQRVLWVDPGRKGPSQVTPGSFIKWRKVGRKAALGTTVHWEDKNHLSYEHEDLSSDPRAHISHTRQHLLISPAPHW